MINNYLQKLSTKQKLLLTKDGLDTLRKRLDELTLTRLKTIQKLRLIDRKDKLDDPSVTNEIYDLEHSEKEISDLHNILQKVEPVVKTDIISVVDVGYTVELDTGIEKTFYTIVSPLEVDIEKGKISEDCPLGQALLGKQVGDTVSVVTLKGREMSYTIISIS